MSHKLVGRLSVDILSASNVKPCDSNGLSDPYCILSCNGVCLPKKCKTSVCKKTLNPIWVESFEFEVKESDTLNLVVMDYDFGRKDDLCGTASVFLPSYKLESGKQQHLVLNLDPQGTMSLVLEFEDENCLFGMPIEAVCLRERTEVPLIITKCIAAIEANGLDREGIYRVPGLNARIDDLRNQFIKSAASAEFKEEDLVKIAIVASLLKRYLRELPDSLFTEALYPSFKAAAQCKDAAKKSELFAAALAGLPAVNRRILYALFLHFGRVVQNQEVNKMSVENMATCFGPTLMTPVTDVPSELEGEHAIAREIVSFLLKNVDLLSPTHAPTPAPPVSATSPPRLPPNDAVSPVPPSAPVQSVPTSAPLPSLPPNSSGFRRVSKDGDLPGLPPLPCSSSKDSIQLQFEANKRFITNSPSASPVSSPSLPRNPNTKAGSNVSLLSASSNNNTVPPRVAPVRGSSDSLLVPQGDFGDETEEPVTSSFFAHNRMSSRRKKIGTTLKDAFQSRQTQNPQMDYTTFCALLNDLGMYSTEKTKEEYDAILAQNGGVCSWDVFKTWWYTKSKDMKIPFERHHKLTQIISSFQYFDEGRKGALNDAQFHAFKDDITAQGFLEVESIDEKSQKSLFDGSGKVSLNHFIRWLVESKRV